MAILTNYSAAVPVIATSDVAGTIRYFEQTLGFEKQWIWGDPPVYGGVKAGGALLYITHDPDLATAIRERPASIELTTPRLPKSLRHGLGGRGNTSFANRMDIV